MAERGYDPRYGARELRREVETTLSQPLAEALVSGGLPHDASARLVFREGGLVLEFPTPGQDSSDAPPAEPPQPSSDDDESSAS